MKVLVYDIKQLCKANRDGSFATQKKREQVLFLVARQLCDELGFRQMRASSLKPKHIDALLMHWRSQHLSVGTIKSRMAQLRWWSVKINKQNVIARSNNHYGIENRQYLSSLSKACSVSDEQLNRIEDAYVKASVKLAKVFGLRKEEAIKLIPTLADKGDQLFLKASWCKGGRERSVPILTGDQRESLNAAKLIAGSGSLIPSHLKYHQQRSRYDAITRAVDLKKLHGLRHQYAQIRYRQLTGWDCPHCGGPERKSLQGDQKARDIQARLKISEELGHNRIQIVANYIGS